MKKIFFLVSLILSIGFITSCTKNQRVKNYGGTANLELPANQKLINVTWKNEQLWYLTRQMNANDSVETYVFREESSYGIVQGKFIIKESKK